MLTTYDSEKLAAAEPDELADALEAGHIVHFPACPFPLPDESDLGALRERLPRQLHVKNVSYHPESDRLHGVRDDAELAALAYRVLTEHSERVQAFLRRTMPALTRGWTVGTSSFRPIQEKGRNLKPHASNELVHIDAGAYGATNGDRILRFFVNVHPEEDRVWGTKGSFGHLLQRYGKDAGITDDPARGTTDYLRKRWPDHLRTGLLRGLIRVGVKEAMVVDSSPFDRVMRRFHNYMKDTPAFQEARDDFEELRFAPGAAWMVLTDTVSHASLSGQHALVNTFLVRLASCRHPELAPINLLRAAPE